MKIQDVLTSMESAVLNKDLARAMETLYWERAAADRFDELENEYDTGKADSSAGNFVQNDPTSFFHKRSQGRDSIVVAFILRLNYSDIVRG